jgi:hypothetical protein
MGEDCRMIRSRCTNDRSAKGKARVRDDAKRKTKLLEHCRRNMN